MSGIVREKNIGGNAAFSRIVDPDQTLQKKPDPGPKKLGKVKNIQVLVA